MPQFTTLPNGLEIPEGTHLVIKNIDDSYTCYKEHEQTIMYWSTRTQLWCLSSHAISLAYLYTNNQVVWIDEDVLRFLVHTNQVKETTKIPCKSAESKDASELCLKASELLAERGKQYDGSGKERSMASTVAAFNAVYGTNLTEQQGWHFMILLKMARQRAGGHIDSAEDLIAYAALAAENTHATLS